MPAPARGDAAYEGNDENSPKANAGTEQEKA
jgi:hypothetical protein